MPITSFLLRPDGPRRQQRARLSELFCHCTLRGGVRQIVVQGAELARRDRHGVHPDAELASSASRVGEVRLSPSFRCL